MQNINLGISKASISCRPELCPSYHLWCPKSTGRIPLAALPFPSTMTTADGQKLNPILRGTVPSASWNQTWIDRSQAKRTVPMKVLVLGWPRTGSKSTSAALYNLGFDDVYHFSCLLENPPDCKMWKRAIDAKWNGKGEFTKKDVSF